MPSFPISGGEEHGLFGKSVYKILSLLLPTYSNVGRLCSLFKLRIPSIYGKNNEKIIFKVLSTVSVI